MRKGSLIAELWNKSDIKLVRASLNLLTSTQNAVLRVLYNSKTSLAAKQIRDEMVADAANQYLRKYIQKEKNDVRIVMRKEKLLSKKKKILIPSLSRSFPQLTREKANYIPIGTVDDQEVLKVSKKLTKLLSKDFPRAKQIAEADKAMPVRCPSSPTTESALEALISQGIVVRIASTNQREKAYFGVHPQVRIFLDKIKWESP